MKKFGIIFLSSFYLLLTSGVGYNIHYCGGYMSSIDLYATTGSCMCGDEEMDMDCCNDETYFFQFDTEPKVAESTKDIHPTLIDLFVACELFNDVNPSSTFQSVDNYGLPPPDPGPIYLLNCSLTYYG